jgi:probable phosphoglycerate mutase
MLRTAFDGSRRRRIYLFRHGDVSYVDDHGNRVADSTIVPLTPWGREQATMTGKALANIPFDRAVVSSFPRSVETAALILAGRDIEIEQNPAFVEFQGDSNARNDMSLHELAYSFKDAAVPGARYVGGDSFEEVNARVVTALERLLAEDHWDTLALVAHGGINRLVIGWAFDTGLATVPMIDQNTCCSEHLLLQRDRRGHASRNRRRYPQARPLAEHRRLRHPEGRQSPSLARTDRHAHEEEGVGLISRC